MILVINAGSSSIKFSVYKIEKNKPLSLRSRGQIEGIGTQPVFIAQEASGQVMAQKTWSPSEKSNHEFLMKFLIDWLNGNLEGAQVKAAGHRVVHGGSEFRIPVVVNDEIFAKLEKLIPLAPLHQKQNLSAIQALQKVYPELPQVACFDTSFHATNPEELRHFFIPRRFETEGIKRYGFHGLSYEYISKVLPQIDGSIARKKIVVAHLGSGASLCALNHGQSLSTSMGLTALDGIPMGTRPGQLDPGVLLYMLRENKMSLGEIENTLYKESGLLGLSGISSDMRVLTESSDPRAVETLQAYVWRVCQMIASLAAVLEGLDALVFTAGIGENSPIIRKRISEKLAWLGVDLDEKSNLAKPDSKSYSPLISSPASRVKVFVIPTNEELMIAEHVMELKNGQ